MWLKLILVALVGLVLPLTSNAQLETKCQDQWTQYLGRCFLPVTYPHSWPWARDFCTNHSAKLAEPSGPVPTGWMVDQMNRVSPTAATSIWIGYNRLWSPRSWSDGFWSAGEQTSPLVGDWAPGEPNTANGQCAFISTIDRKWHMGSCDSIRPFACEQDPCPAGIRDTFMCNGKCIGPQLVCDGTDDCGNNLDELNCPDQDTFTYTTTSGSISLDQLNGLYMPSKTYIWIIRTIYGSRLQLQVVNFLTENDTDTLRFYDGSAFIPDTWTATLSGDQTNYTYYSMYNAVLLKFTSDATYQYRGFGVTWTTVGIPARLPCKYNTMAGYTISNTDSAIRTSKLTSAMTTDKCETECDEMTDCIGFRFEESNTDRYCHYINKLPVLKEETSSTLFINSCAPPSPPGIEANGTPQQLSTPSYPFSYPGNGEWEYTIQASKNFLISLKVLTVELCCGDYIDILDKDGTLLARLTHDSEPGDLIISTSNRVDVRMVLYQHRQCRGVLIEITRGCDNSVSGTGRITSPGWNTVHGYSNLHRCTWNIQAPSMDRSVTLRFDAFHTDEVLLTKQDGSTETITSSSEITGETRTAEGYMNVTFVSGSPSRVSGSPREFSISYSPGCPSLQTYSYELSSTNSNFGSNVVVSCMTGSYFTGDHSGQTELQLECLYGGSWSLSPPPSCQRSFCGKASKIDHGYAGSSTGVTVTYLCNEGYSMTGKSVVTCLENNQWEQLPVCTSTATCSHLSTLAFVGGVMASIISGDGQQHGSVVNFTCPLYTDLIGASSSHCVNGIWGFVNNELPYCQRKRCETPVIEHATLEANSPFYVNQPLTASCNPGYKPQGPSPTFNCGVTASLPSCAVRQCNISSLSNVRPVQGVGTEFPYGQTVQVTCGETFTPAGVTTSTLNITCQETGEWDQTPVCSVKGCPPPVRVNGSQYLPTAPCQNDGCQFEFRCQQGYVKYGSSNLYGNATVSCGGVKTGAWDFGTLKCGGAQCDDPGAPASGQISSSTGSFEEGTLVTVTCKKQGYQPLTSSGEPFFCIKCVYNAVTKRHNWNDTVPTCNDTQKPTFLNCPTKALKVEMLDAPNYDPIQGADNNAINSTAVFPVGHKSRQPVYFSTSFYIFFRDYADNEELCRINVMIPEYIQCLNVNTTVTVTGSSMTVNTGLASYLTRLVNSTVATVIISPNSIVITNNEYPRLPIEVNVTAINTTTNEILDNCTLQFRFVEGPGCNGFSLDAPNAVKSCVGSECTFTCNTGYYFMSQPAAASSTLGCVNGDWNSSAPICASSTNKHVIYTALYNIKYALQLTGDDDGCDETRGAIVNTNLQNFAAAMMTQCDNQAPGSVFTIKLLTSVATLNTQDNSLHVFFTFLIQLGDESVSNAQTLKDNCANSIQSSMNRQTNIATIRNLNSESCGTGNFDPSPSEPSYGSGCNGTHRKFANVGGSKMCLTCPLGYQYNNVTDKCVKCPAGTYSLSTDEGMRCVDCPDNLNPGLVGLKNASECRYKSKCLPGQFSKDGLSPCRLCPKGFYSSSEYSRTCTPCQSNETTFNEGSLSISDCKSQAQAESDQAEDETLVSPCKPSPCLNGGTCTYKQRDAYCTCPQGWSGDTCEIEQNSCHSNPCENDQACTVGQGGTYICACNLNTGVGNELSGNECQIDNHGCAPSYCKNNGTCHNRHGSYMCMCPSYSGYINSNGSCDTKNEPCRFHPCLNGGSCVQYDHHYRACNCAPGFTGEDCELDIDDCSTIQCNNGGTCEDKVDGFVCQCREKYHGEYCQFVQACEQECDGTTTFCHRCNAENTLTCTNVANTYRCSCKSGYKGNDCEIEMSPCNSYPCQHGGTCESSSLFAHSCQCREPYTGTNCQVLNNNCPDGDRCHHNGKCYNTGTGYVCNCTSDYIGNNCSEAYDLCEKTRPCLPEGGSCSLTEAGATSCSCNDGYSGDSCQVIILSCNTNPCQNGATCSDSTGTVICTCPAGYIGSTCDTAINLCDSSPCGSNKDCIPSVGSYTCVCTTGKRGINCDKDVDGGVGYIIKAELICRQKASMVRFSASQPLTSWTIVFRVRYIKVYGEGVIFTIIFAPKSVPLIPQDPDYLLKFSSQQVYIESPSTRKRKKRNIQTLSYDRDLDDGNWHHIMLTWDSDAGEITLYADGRLADQAFFAQGESLDPSGFLVAGDYDPITGQTNPYNSHEGLLTQLDVRNEKVAGPASLSASTSSSMLNQALTMMRLHSVTYNTENSELCVNNNNCYGFPTGMVPPQPISCPKNHLAVSERDQIEYNLPTIPFGENYTPISNIQAGTTQAWGISGHLTAVFDSSGNAGLCSYVFYNREVACTIPSSAPSDVCSSVTGGGILCSDTCPTGQALPAGVPRFQACSRSSMFGQDVMHSPYNYPQCSATASLTANMTFDLTVTTSEACSDIISDYTSAVKLKMNAFSELTSPTLCGGSCDSFLTNAFTCSGTNTMLVHINFGLLSSTISYDGNALNHDELMRIAVGSGVFTYTSPPDAGNIETVTPVITSFAVTSEPMCTPGYEVAGDVCVQCGAGTQYNATTKMCTRCPVGWYSTDTTDCTLCPNGETTGSDGARGENACQVSCPKGKYFNMAALTCLLCPRGFYQDREGQFYCKPCLVTETTSRPGSNSSQSCVDPATITTTTQTPVNAANVGASTESSGLSTGIIVAIVLGVLVFLLIVFLIACFCCCQGIAPCFKKKQAVAPVVKDGYYAQKYGEVDMRFVSYNLKDVREKKGRPLDRVPIVESPPSDDTASVESQHSLSFHVPVFMEKLDGSVRKKQLYMSNGGQTMNSTITPRSQRFDLLEPMTSSPRGSNLHHYDQAEQDVSPGRHSRRKRRRRKHQHDHSRHRSHDNTYEEPEGSPEGRRPKALPPMPHHSRQRHRSHDDTYEEPVGRRPKALAPVPQHIKSLPPSETVITSEYIRPSSALNQRRQQVEPAQYEEFLEPARSPKRSRPPRDHRSHHRHHAKEEMYNDPQAPTPLQQIVVESDEDLR